MLLIIEKKLLLRVLGGLPSVAGRAYTLFMILCGWPMFYYTSGAKIFEFAQAAFGVGVQVYDVRAISALGMNAFILPVLIAGCTPLPRKAARYIKERDSSGLLGSVGNAVIVVASFIAIIGQSYSPFLYFRF